MEEQKRKRVISAFIVGAVLFVIILLSVLIFQIVKIKSEKKDLKLLQDKITEYRLLTEEEKELQAAMETREWIIQKARELGLKLEGDYALD